MGHSEHSAVAPKIGHVAFKYAATDLAEFSTWNEKKKIIYRNSELGEWPISF